MTGVTFHSLPDPPVRPDGACIVCGKQRHRPALKPLYAKAAAADPFCSATCARQWHDAVLPVSTRGPGSGVTGGA